MGTTLWVLSGAVMRFNLGFQGASGAEEQAVVGKVSGGSHQGGGCAGGGWLDLG